MRRYLVFAGHVYYPEGGWWDFVTDHDDLGTARQASTEWVQEPDCHWGPRWAHVVDTETGKVWEREDV